MNRFETRRKNQIARNHFRHVDCWSDQLNKIEEEKVKIRFSIASRESRETSIRPEEIPIEQWDNRAALNDRFCFSESRCITKLNKTFAIKPPPTAREHQKKLNQLNLQIFMFSSTKYVFCIRSRSENFMLGCMVSASKDLHEFMEIHAATSFNVMRCFSFHYHVDFREKLWKRK